VLKFDETFTTEFLMKGVKVPPKNGLLANHAYQKLISGIFDGTFKPGSKLSTQELSVSFGMSRTPVIAAINRLIAQGIATEIPHRGVIVAKLEPNQIRNFIDIRKMMELFAVNSAIKNAGFYPEILDEMERIAKDLSSLPDTAYENVTILENRFHLNYITLTNNRELVKLYEMNWGIGVAVYTYLMAKIPILQYQESCREHFSIVECLRAGDENGLIEIAERHLDVVYNTLNWISTNDGGLGDWY